MAERVRTNEITLGAGVTQVLKFYPSRKSFVLTNPNALSIRVHTKNNAGPSRGITLNSGGTLGFNILEDGELVRWEWYVYAPGTAEIEIYEVIDDGRGQ